ncbi:MAG: 2-oxo acid dehydrogenase subunit E2 [Actinobacteria bacterium]|nr:2-oxo acid dehydrogenase subunit E2 [Actinomycetota bacterium]
MQNKSNNIIPQDIKIKSSTELTGIQKIIAQRMTLSKTTIPHLLQNIKVDITSIISLKEEVQEKLYSNYGIKVTYTDFLLKIIATALREYIEINSSYINQKYIIYDDINIGLAISVNNDLVVATIYNMDKLGIIEIAKRRIELIEKAKSQKLSLADVKYSTITVTNVGMYGIRSTYAIINPPQAAILAIAEIYKEPAIINEDILPRSFIEISLSVDHRIINGALSAQFLHRIAYLIENPGIIFEDI